ncbi:MAG: CapA family protein [Mobilitalea sp.]
MKKKNIIILSVVCILSLCMFSGLLVYAFDLQAKRDLKEKSVIPTEAAAQSAANDSNKDTSLEADAEEAENTDSQETNPATPTPIEEIQAKPIVLGFAGDINFDEDSYPVAKYDSEKNGILGGLSSDLVKEMNAADVMILNNEFAYSTRGTKTPDKSYTFRADPSRVGILNEMGVDIVSLANNHALDYGPDALLDTFEALDGAGVEYIGAGIDMDRAKAPIYFTVGDKTIAYVAASRVVFSMDWYANDTRLGMIGTYDPTLFLESIKEAAENSDYVVAFVHWGVERENYPQTYQRTLATQYIDAGADAVVGCHPHVLQGFEYYKGKPIAYSLGNFWFNNSTRETGFLKLYLDTDDTVRMQILPAMSKSTFTYLLTEEAERTTYFDFMEEISYGTTIDEDGFVTIAE